MSVRGAVENSISKEALREHYLGSEDSDSARRTWRRVEDTLEQDRRIRVISRGTPTELHWQWMEEWLDELFSK